MCIFILRFVLVAESVYYLIQVVIFLGWLSYSRLKRLNFWASEF